MPEKIISGFKVTLHDNGKVHVSKEVGHIYVAAWKNFSYFGNAQNEYDSIKSLNSVKTFMNASQDQYFSIR